MSHSDATKRVRENLKKNRASKIEDKIEAIDKGSPCKETISILPTPANFISRFDTLCFCGSKITIGDMVFNGEKGVTHLECPPKRTPDKIEYKSYRNVQFLTPGRRYCRRCKRVHYGRKCYE